MPIKNNKEVDICGDTDCLIRTCSRHRCQFRRSKRWAFNWKSYKDVCGLYKSKNAWRTHYVPPKLEMDDIFYINPDESNNEYEDGDEQGREEGTEVEGDVGFDSGGDRDSSGET